MTIRNAAKEAVRSVQDTLQDDQQPPEVSTLSAIFLNTPDQPERNEAAVVVIDGHSTRRGSSSTGGPRPEEVESVDPAEYLHTVFAVLEADYVSDPHVYQATAHSARTRPEDSSLRHLTPETARNDVAESNPGENIVSQERMEHLLEHLALLAAENPRGWTVADAIAYIATIPSCTGCVEEFSAQITGREALFLLNEDYLINTMGLTLGLALKVCDVVRSLI
ncbi:polyhomeotic-like protein 2 [Amblyomma americanum]